MGCELYVNFFFKSGEKLGTGNSQEVEVRRESRTRVISLLEQGKTGAAGPAGRWLQSSLWPGGGRCGLEPSEEEKQLKMRFLHKV